ncbi:MAG: hypothetical protein D6763_08925 [Alphaproteobacteria bacterium]|nr:MAG: hypothetical protein D6763_08925 [Alphaproteobacteria bacterium]
MAKKPELPRKPLRQRVAERRAGIKPEADQKAERWRKRFGFFANILQGVALVMLLIYMFQYLIGDVATISYMIVGFYAILFVIGRAIRIGLDIQRMTKRH